MILVFWFLLLALSIFALIKGSDLFTTAAEKIGLSFGIPAFIIGVTIVSLGTSLPEFMTAIFAVLSNNTEIVIGNVVGSNITNIFLGLGVLPLIIGYFTINKNLVGVDLPILLSSTFVIAITCLDGIFTRIEAIFCLAGFVIYMKYAANEHTEFRKRMKEEEKELPGVSIKTIIILILGCGFLYFGAEYTVKSIIRLSEILKIGTDVVTASAVALATSLPEIVTGVVAAKKGQIEIAVGTLIGSNVFNAFGIMGISGLLGDLIIPAKMTDFGIYMLIVATLLSFFITLDKEITKFEGGLLVLFYILFLGKLFSLF